MTSLQRLGKNSSSIAPLLVAILAVFLMQAILGFAKPVTANEQAPIALVAPRGAISVETELPVTAVDRQLTLEEAGMELFLPIILKK